MQETNKKWQCRLVIEARPQNKYSKWYDDATSCLQAAAAWIGEQASQRYLTIHIEWKWM